MNAHTPAEAQLSWQGWVCALIFELNRQPVNSIALKQLLTFIESLAGVLSKDFNCSNCYTMLPDDPAGANTEGGY